MSADTRRSFLKGAALGLTAAAVVARSKAQASKASERVRVGVIGCGNQGTAHLKSLKTLSDAEIVYVCDIDPERLGKGVDLSGSAKGVSDFRRILDDRT